MGIRHLARRAGPATALALASIMGSVSPAFAGGDAMGKYYERSFVLAAHQRCGLFKPEVAAALTAAAWQARGAALRAGVTEAEVAARAGRARAQASGVDCGSADLVVVQGRVNQGFEGWRRTARMTFPGDRAEWAANRGAYSTPTWRLAQTSSVGASPVTFGAVGGLDRADRLAAVVSFAGKPRPYAARLVMRDPDLAPRAWLSGEGLAPESQNRVFLSSGSASADRPLLGDQRQGELWTFPAAAAQALSRLDPREGFTVEFLFRDDSTARVRFEAGDFAAARAFLAMGAL